jgi:hypothetical protein
MGGLRPHPDGRRLATTDFKVNLEVWVMENFLPKPAAPGAKPKPDALRGCAASITTAGRQSRTMRIRSARAPMAVAEGKPVSARRPRRA